MLRELKLLRRKSEKDSVEGNENIPSEDQADSSSVLPALDPSRPPLNTIVGSAQNPRNASAGESEFRFKAERTPSKRVKMWDSSAPFRTPERFSASSNKRRMGTTRETASEASQAQQEGIGNRTISYGNASLINTPRIARCGIKTASNHSDTGSIHTTPSKSVIKPPNTSSFHSHGSKPPLNISSRNANYSLMSKGISTSLVPTTAVNTVDVPHFDLKEDPSFWMDHNVQVLVRVRPLNDAEKNLHGYSRCLSQDSAQTITWIGQPEARFTFDHVACETVNQEMLFRVAGLPMVENCLSGYNSSIFAYGQTGSGKTYTMLGEINDLDLRPSTDRGMTSRIFEFLFARIRAEEESRLDEKLKYNCRCSFLEIYNEQITDLLDPSSTNLLLREDISKCVYVENLSEYGVETVNDVLKLLMQGAANRKVAATNMNRESSRSHSVFTCVIESRWEKESACNLRYAKLNLVDLAGSERQKTSGADGERLKEAASINKSLSTLGHVIMLLADLAQGKHRHIPYRDSRLTFLLQDSLGGNSKTMIIANVSPSICSAPETISTLNFAKRAKLIQNNAVVNEDASGDVYALQCQIRLLKEELSFLKRQNVSRSLSLRSAILENMEHEKYNSSDQNENQTPEHSSVNDQGCDSFGSVRLSNEKLKSLEKILAGALRRELMAENSVKQLQAEIEQLNRLVRQREEDGRCLKMQLKFREDKIQRMESLMNESLMSDSFSKAEYDSLAEELQLLQIRIDKNPEITRFALENIRLQEQLRRFQEFYEEGEKDILLSELSELRDKLFECLSWKSSRLESQELVHEDKGIIIPGLTQTTTTREDLLKNELDKTQQELEDCRENMRSCLELNERLTREISELNIQLKKYRSITDEDVCIHSTKVALCSAAGCQEFMIRSQKEEDQNQECSLTHSEEVLNLQLELDILKIILDEERLIRQEAERKALKLHEDLRVTKNELDDSKSVIDALESQQILSINELEELRQNNNHYMNLLSRRDSFLEQPEDGDSRLQARLERVQTSLEQAKKLNMRFQNDKASMTSQQRDVEEVQSQVEAETAEVIVCLQEELATLQQQIDEHHREEMAAQDENKKLRKILEEKNLEQKVLTEEWDRLAHEIFNVLADGNILLPDASYELDDVDDSMPKKRIRLTEHVGSMARLIVKKEMQIEELQKNLVDACRVRDDVEWKMRYLKGATFTLTEAQEEDRNEKEKEIIHLQTEIHELKFAINESEKMLQIGEDRVRKAELCSTVAFMTVNWLRDKYLAHLEEMRVKMKETESPRLLKQDSDIPSNDHTEEKNFRLESKISEDLFHSSEQLAEFRKTLSSIGSNMNEYVAGVGRLKVVDDRKPETEATVDKKNSGGWTSAIKRTKESCEDKDEVIFLLRKEIVSALESLKGVQIQMCDLLSEKKDIVMAESERRNIVNDIKSQMVELETQMSVLKNTSENAMSKMANKLCHLEEKQQKRIKDLQLELAETRTLLAQKSAESISLIEKFEEAQATITEADVMVNALLTAKEVVKLENDKLKRVELALLEERNILEIEVGNLQSCLKLMNEKCTLLEIASNTTLSESKTLESLLEDIISEFESTINIDLSSILRDFHELKIDLAAFVKMAKTSLEAIWFDMIGKDCAISVLHLCHIGVLLETVTGLNAENSLLQHGLLESNSMITDLRECTLRARKELEICKTLEGKLLVDIKNSFNRLTKGEENASKLGISVTIFEKKIEDLQMQEDSMLALCNSMGTQLSALLKDIDGHRSSSLATIVRQESLLKDIDEVFGFSMLRDRVLSKETVIENNQIEMMIVNLFENDFQLLVLTSELKEQNSLLNEMAFMGAKQKENKAALELTIETLSRELSCATLESELRLLLIEDREAKLSELEVESVSTMDRVATMQVNERKFTKQIDFLRENQQMENEDLRSQIIGLTSRLDEVIEANEKTSLSLIGLLNDKESAAMEHRKKEATIESNLIYISSLQNDLNSKETECRDNQHLISIIEKELDGERQQSKDLKDKLLASEENINLLKSNFDQFVEKQSNVELFSKQLGERIDGWETSVIHICTEFDLKKVELFELETSHSIIAAECESILKEVDLIKRKGDEIEVMLSLSPLNIKRCSDLIRIVDSISDRVYHILGEDRCYSLLSKLFEDICSCETGISKLVADSECLENNAKELMLENLSLQNELTRKEEIMRGLLFDLSLLQESTSFVKDRKDDFEEIEFRVESLEEDLAVKSCELDAALDQCHTLDIKLQESQNLTVGLQSDIDKLQEALKLESDKNLEMKDLVDQLKLVMVTMEEELFDKRKMIGRLEEENYNQCASIRKMSEVLEDYKCKIVNMNQEKDKLESDMNVLKEKLEMAQVFAEEQEAVATEACQMVQMSKAYSMEKEEEVKLLEKSVEELECTINVLENKVQLLRGEAERQRSEREVLELELRALRHQILELEYLNQRPSSEDMITKLHKCEDRMRTLERLIEEKDAQVAQCKTHISELNMHAEAQAREYKQKFKALEAMVEEVKPETSTFTNDLTALATSKSEKNAVKSRASGSPYNTAKPKGSGSPFKCIGLGLSHQLNSEKEEELTAGRLRIEELEAVVASRQKEIFMLNTRLAAAESMTHDVIRDLLGVKLDMSDCVSLLDHQQVNSTAEKGRLHDDEYAQKDREIAKLKEQLNAFIKERQSWLDDMNRKHAEVVEARVAAEKLRQREDLLSTENEIFKLEIANQIKMIADLNMEVKKLSGQQNLQQRIHHHAKIKEENNILRTQNDELVSRLQRSEIILSRVKEELAQYRASNTNDRPLNDFDEEDRLKKQLEDSEEERVQLARKLVGLCTSILKAAGITKPESDITPSIAEEALTQLTDKIAAGESELMDLKFKNKMGSEKMKLSDLGGQSSTSIWSNENCRSST